MTGYEARVFRTAIGRRLRERRVALGLTQEEVGWAAGVAQGSISHYEHGKNEVPLGVLLSLCRVLGLSPLEVVPGLAEQSTGHRVPELELTARAS